MGEADMKAIVYDAPQQFSHREVPMPELAPDEVLIRVRSCGICGTDLHIHEGECLTKFPLIPGHELAGEDVDVRAAVGDGKVGERVVCELAVRCGDRICCARDARRPTVK